jgi:hypothetical protein
VEKRKTENDDMQCSASKLHSAGMGRCCTVAVTASLLASLHALSNLPLLVDMSTLLDLMQPCSAPVHRLPTCCASAMPIDTYCMRRTADVGICCWHMLNIVAAQISWAATSMQGSMPLLLAHQPVCTAAAVHLVACPPRSYCFQTGTMQELQHL